MKCIVIPSDHVFMHTTPSYEDEDEAIAAAELKAADEPGRKFVVLVQVVEAATEAPAKPVLPVAIQRFGSTKRP